MEIISLTVPASLSTKSHVDIIEIKLKNLKFTGADEERLSRREPSEKVTDRPIGHSRDEWPGGTCAVRDQAEEGRLVRGVS